MDNQFEYLKKHLNHLSNQHNLNICIKDFCGLIPINKDLNAALSQFVSHDNKYCMYMKSDEKMYSKCISMIRKTYQKCENCSNTFYGVCHAGVGEYITPIISKGNVLGTVNMGFFSPGEDRAIFRIKKTCAASASLNFPLACQLYENTIVNAQINASDIIPFMEMLAEYLSFSYETYLHMKRDDNGQKKYKSSESIISAHAISYIRQNFINRITIDELADYCHCSTSYLSRIFKRHTGININTYINKIRVEESKQFLISNDISISQIATNVGFNDPNYFSRVFTQLTDISPKEFRHRFQYPD